MIYEEDRIRIERYHLIIEATELAARLHAGQTRKDGVTPYIVHPIRVASTVMEIFRYIPYRNFLVISLAALFHDVKKECGEEGMKKIRTFLLDSRISLFDANSILHIISLLTLDNELLIKTAKMEACVATIVKERSYSAAMIKLCDRLDNLRSMKNMDEKFQKKYLKETEIILKGFYQFTEETTPCQIMWDNLRREYDYWDEKLKMRKK